ncbi:hypothetical protein BMR1_02g01670 [Babesia microti strain RI]|uniref:Uncharacterized protein n=1 Tax=Babesia microti (strain RI) TaxID=1133968 RepID=A0A1R4AAA2_BABMR|nr:hypothetical protein BMR1_02g01670 [Babesia microti strain RI]SJK85929.1 hypothetical protein BMR1_02g01670 [Babesia microti strain RI]|eukprot:XP_021338136.1 hypothetical protein BMR1_02g01670 [Babesia microti strain RI]
MSSKIKTPFGHLTRSFSKMLSSLYSPIVPISLVVVPFSVNYMGVFLFNWPFHNSIEKYKFECLTRRVNAPAPEPTPIEEQFSPPTRYVN